jgi:transposase
MTKRKQYSEQFKREAVRLLVTRDGDTSARDIARSLGIAASQLYQWRKQYPDVAQTAKNDRGESKDEELARLRKEVLQLRKEKEVLKKSALLLLRDSDR